MVEYCVLILIDPGLNRLRVMSIVQAMAEYGGLMMLPREVRDAINACPLVLPGMHSLPWHGRDWETELTIAGATVMRAREAGWFAYDPSHPPAPVATA